MNKPIHPTAMIGEEVELGYNVVIAEHVRIGNQVYLGNSMIVHTNSSLADRVKVKTTRG